MDEVTAGLKSHPFKARMYFKAKDVCRGFLADVGTAVPEEDAEFPNGTARVFAGVPLVDSQGWGRGVNLHLSWYGSP